MYSLFIINEGYHTNKFIVERKKNNWKFIIPKGTKYYENYSEYVSEQLIYIGKV